MGYVIIYVFIMMYVKWVMVQWPAAVIILLLIHSSVMFVMLVSLHYNRSYQELAMLCSRMEYVQRNSLKIMTS